MSALQDQFRPKVVPEWHGPTTVEGVTAMLAKAQGLGATERERIAMFLTLPQAQYLPERLRLELQALAL